LLDAKADLLVYGMGEAPITEIARRLAAGEEVSAMRDIRGTVVRVRAEDVPDDAIELPTFEAVSTDGRAFAETCKQHLMASSPGRRAPIVQRHEKEWVLENPPPEPMSQEELDAVYALPFTRKAHPAYDSKGGVPALESVEFSVTTHRGCFGGCSFCALGLHQGRTIQSRSVESVLSEIRGFEAMADYRGIVYDLGGPTANMYGMMCRRQEGHACERRSCLHPSICRNLDASHGPVRKLMKAARQLPGVRRAFVASGVRHDLALRDRDYLRDLVQHHVGGHLKIAPEHVSGEVLDRMGKPGVAAFGEFVNAFTELSRQAGREQYVVPYLMSSHPGCTMAHMRELAQYFQDRRWHVEQVQDFLPTPMTVSTAMYHTGLCPFSNQRVHVAKSLKERTKQRGQMPHRQPRKSKRRT